MFTWLGRRVEQFDTGLDSLAGGRLGHVTDDIADGLESASQGNVSAQFTNTAVPIAAAAATGGATLLVADQVSGVGRRFTDVIRRVVTLNGELEKIPVLGNVFTGAGWLVDRAGDASGYAFSGLAALTSYKLFRPTVSPPNVRRSETPDAGTGAVPQAPVTEETSVWLPNDEEARATEEVPVSPQPVEPSASTQQLLQERPEMAERTYSELREERRELLTFLESTGVTNVNNEVSRVEEQIRVLMQEENQRYENRREFLRHTVAYDSGPGGPRDSLVRALVSAGVASQDAQFMVPAAPMLRYTVTMADHGGVPSETENSLDSNGNPTDFGGEYAELERIGQELEDFYGAYYFRVHRRNDSGQNVPDRKLFKDMSVTQKHEFLQLALRHAQNNLIFFQEKCVQRHCSPSGYPGGGGSTSITYNYEVRYRTGWENLFGANIPEGRETYHDMRGNPLVRTWRDEHQFLMRINRDYVSRSSLRTAAAGQWSFQDYVSGDQIRSAESAFGRWQALMDRHKEQLRVAENDHNGRIHRFTDRMNLMLTSNELMRSTGVALLRAHTVEGDTANGSHYVDIQDLLQNAGNSSPNNQGSVYRLQGEWVGNRDDGNWQFIVRSVGRRGEDAMRLQAPITVNLRSGQNMDALKNAIHSNESMVREMQQMEVSRNEGFLLADTDNPVVPRLPNSQNNQDTERGNLS